jgi:sugar O-acyltransferase (sialic acid O-acetyltransferase NeuD family)
MGIKKNKILIFGLNDFAELAHYYITNDSDHDVEAFVVTKEYFEKNKFSPRGTNIEYPVELFETIEAKYSPSEFLFFIPMSGIKMNKTRRDLYLKAKNKGYDFYSYISSHATVLTEEIGENCFIFEDNTIQPFVTIGNNVTLWSGNHIGHHSCLMDHVFITSHVVISGHVTIKERAWFGVNSTIRDGITIEEGAMVAMGALITKNVEENSVMIGSPAKKHNVPADKLY